MVEKEKFYLEKKKENFWGLWEVIRKFLKAVEGFEEIFGIESVKKKIEGNN